MPLSYQTVPFAPPAARWCDDEVAPLALSHIAVLAAEADRAPPVHLPHPAADGGRPAPEREASSARRAGVERERRPPRHAPALRGELVPDVVRLAERSRSP